MSSVPALAESFLGVVGAVPTGDGEHGRAPEEAVGTRTEVDVHRDVVDDHHDLIVAVAGEHVDGGHAGERAPDPLLHTLAARARHEPPGHGPAGPPTVSTPASSSNETASRWPASAR